MGMTWWCELSNPPERCEVVRHEVEALLSPYMAMGYKLIASGASRIRLFERF